MTGGGGTADTHLAIYGTLAPGRVNRHHLDEVEWALAARQGERQARRCRLGAEFGYAASVLDPLGPAVAVYRFQSSDLTHHWARLDAFDGTSYRRVVMQQVSTADGEVDAWIHALAT